MFQKTGEPQVDPRAVRELSSDLRQDGFGLYFRMGCRPAFHEHRQSMECNATFCPVGGSLVYTTLSYGARCQIFAIFLPLGFFNVNAERRHDPCLWYNLETGATIVNSDLYDHPVLYDELFPVGEHLPYYMGLARQASGGVLELACGSGQITVPIAGAGLPIVGLDLSQSCLNVASERASAANVSPEFVLGDMRNFDLGRKFALIFIARNSLLHLHSTEDLLAAFAAIRRHLAHRGIFAFDIFNPNVRLLARPPGQRFPVFEKETSSFGKITVEQTSAYDPATQVGYSRWYISGPGKPDAWQFSLDLRNIFPQELPLLLAAGGLHLERRTGDFSKVLFDSSSRFQICVCRSKA